MIVVGLRTASPTWLEGLKYMCVPFVHRRSKLWTTCLLTVRPQLRGMVPDHRHILLPSLAPDRPMTLAT
jgi:hypothetical protein